MIFYGFWNGAYWLNNDFQSPHFSDIYALIAACYESEEIFRSEHGDPESWEKREISEAELMHIFGV